MEPGCTQMSKTVFITGGSSGIGLALAMAMAQQNPDLRLALFARDADRLAAAAQTLALSHSRCDIRIFPVDLSDSTATVIALDAAVAAFGPPDVLILSAGMTRPGRWHSITLADHRKVIEINYFGSLSVIHHLAPVMPKGAAICLIGSAAGLVATYGYAAYAPSKYALRGLAETLRIELRPRGISVTLCLPPDTDTPMLVAEQPLRPIVTSHMAAGAPVMSADAVAQVALAAMNARRFLALPGLTVKLLYLFGPWIAPLLRWQQARLIRRYGED
jgi:3-dehydrosphinganine reductase